MLKEQLLKRFEEVKPRPGEAAALVDRMNASKNWGQTRIITLAGFLGHLPAQDAGCLALGQRVMAVPIAARRLST